jgi:hypothetical protein
MLLLERVLASTDDVGTVTASEDDVLRAQRLQQTTNIVGFSLDVLDVAGLADSTTTLAINWDKMPPEQWQFQIQNEFGIADCNSIKTGVSKGESQGIPTTCANRRASISLPKREQLRQRLRQSLCERDGMTSIYSKP